jgi:hypothetical protein
MARRPLWNRAADSKAAWKQRERMLLLSDLIFLKTLSPIMKDIFSTLQYKVRFWGRIISVSLNSPVSLPITAE